MRMVATPLDKINYNKVSKYANVLIFKEFYPKTKNVSYYLNRGKESSRIRICIKYTDSISPSQKCDLLNKESNYHVQEGVNIH